MSQPRKLKLDEVKLLTGIQATKSGLEFAPFINTGCYDCVWSGLRKYWKQGEWTCGQAHTEPAKHINTVPEGRPHA